MGYCMVMDWPVAAQLVAVVLLAVLLLLAAVLLFRRRVPAVLPFLEPPLTHASTGAFVCRAQARGGRGVP